MALRRELGQRLAREALAATGGILLLAGNPHGGDHLRDLLVGQILWSTWESLLPIVLIYAVILAAWRFTHRFLGGLGFYVSFGIVGSSLLDLPTGAVIVWTMAAIALAANFATTKWQPAAEARET